MADGNKNNASTILGTPTIKRPPKGGRKGGTIFPRLGLQQALEYAKKLVSRTAVATQPESTVLAGVFGNSGPEGKVRLSALKQFGLLEGTSKGYRATQLAKDIDGAPDEQAKKVLLNRTALAPKVYRELFNTYHGDLTTKAKIRNRALQLGVHPDAGDMCSEMFIASALTAGLGTADGDAIRLAGATDAVTPQSVEESDAENTNETTGEGPVDPDAANQSDAQQKQNSGNQDGTRAAKSPTSTSTVTLNLTVDSGTDGDKLEKQLTLLRRFGLI